MSGALLERVRRAEPPWMTRGECRTPRVAVQIAQGKVNFFPEKGRSAGQAKLVCAECEVRQECALYAIARPELHGIWGGLSPRQRRQLRQAAAA